MPIFRIILPVLMIAILLPVEVTAKTFGAGLTLDQSTPLSEVLAAPDQYVGQKIQLQGLIIEVCERRGCWLNISGEKPFEKMRVKVNDGEIVFPLEARGKQGKVEGILQKFVLTRQQVIRQLQHYAEERGEPFDPATVTSGETIYQLRGLGAEIKGL